MYFKMLVSKNDSIIFSTLLGNSRRFDDDQYLYLLTLIQK